MLAAAVVVLHSNGTRPFEPFPYPYPYPYTLTLTLTLARTRTRCGHGGICFACAQRCFKKKGRICPMCRQPVTQVVHIERTLTCPLP